MIERFGNCARQFTIGARIEAHRDVADSDMDRAAVAFIDREDPRSASRRRWQLEVDM